MKILAILICVLMSIAGAQAEEACYFEIDLISDDLVWLDTYYYGEGIGDLLRLLYSERRPEDCLLDRAGI